MRKLLLGAVALVAGGTSAFAADLPARTYTKAPPIVAPVYNWTGFYVGANIGGGFGNVGSFETGLPIGNFGTLLNYPLDTIRRAFSAVARLAITGSSATG